MTNLGKCDGRLGLQIHAIVFVATMALLFAINLFTGAPFWALWVFLAWGIGLAAHAISHAATRPHKVAKA
ncbi:2TM domain-containing protein [Devosia sp.]|uniref:2TM domain-containing protein n=1 Tax=Devosia sp. TaxID=1871048 RepID=UPI001B2ADAEB|nr:2TM domain-containing protein [Devosia sp.]MBO9589753.1 2TM domain-containing protein [Devosia sp.]